MATRKTLIVERYVLLEVELKKHMKAELFPSLNSVDVADLVYLITISFLGVDSTEQYNAKIQELMDGNGVKVDAPTFAIVAPLIQAFVAWMKQL